MSKSNLTANLVFLLLFLSTYSNAFVENECKEDVAVTELIKVCSFSGAYEINSTASSSCQGAGVTLFMGDGCDDQVLMSIHFVNLLPYTPPKGSGPHQLPGDMPELRVEYDTNFDGEYDYLSEPINEFFYTGLKVAGNFTPIEYDVYRHELTLSEIIINNPCLDPPPGVPNTVGDFNIRLVQNTNGVYETYDLEDYATTHGVASCEVFAETCGYCSTEGGLGGNTNVGGNCTITDPEYVVDICVDCDFECITREDLSENSEAQELENTSLISVTPNPFYDHVMLEYFSAREETIEIEVIDVKGSVVKKQLVNTTAGQQTTDLNLSELSKGIYFCRLKKTTGNEMVKIIKTR